MSAGTSNMCVACQPHRRGSGGGLDVPSDHGVQVLIWVLSYDGVNSAEPLAITAAAAALALSGGGCTGR